MAEWKKVVVSGSSAELSNLNVDSAVTASFFKGDGSALTNIAIGALAGNISESAQVFQDVSGDVSIASNGTAAIGSGVIVNDDINASAAIAYGKLNLTGAVVNDDLAGSIANSKLANDGITIAGNDTSLGGSITAATILDGTGVHSGSAQVVAALSNQDVNLGTGDITATSGSFSHIKVGEYIEHSGDADTRVRFQADDVSLQAGGINLFRATTSEVVINEPGQDVDFRVESNNNANLFYANAGNNRIGILNDSPSTALDVTGTVTATAFAGDGSALTGIVAAGSVSGSSQVVLESADKTGFTGASSITTLGTVTSGNVTAILPSGTISSSAQLADDFIDTLGDGVFSGSAQVDGTAITNNSLTVTAGDGLSGGGSVALGGTVSVAVQVDDSSLEIDSDTVRVKASGITNAMLGGSIANAKLANSSVTVTAGDGLSGGGAVSLGGTVSVAVQVDDSSLEIDSDTVRVKASGITNAMLGGSIANDKLANDGITIAGNDISLGGTITAATILAGSGVLSGSANADTATSSSFASNAASANAVANNSVVLGTSTTGDYIASLGSGTGVTIGSNSGEGSNPTIAVNYGSSANQAVQGNQTATFTGTANEITVSNSAAQALGGGISVQIGLPDDVTIAGTGSVNGDLSVAGNLSVGGDLTYINSTDLMVTDPFILLNSGSNGATQGDSGIIFGGADGVVNSGNLLFWDKSYNGNDGRLSIKNGFAHTTTGNPTPDYSIAGVIEGSAADAVTAQADHVGNIRVESEEIYIYV